MNDDGKQSIQDVMERLSTEHYLGNVEGLAVVRVDKNGELEMLMGFNSVHVYAMVAGCDIMKQNIINDIINDAGKRPDKRDI